MNAENLQRVRLTGGPKHTSSSVEVRPDGSLVVEFYDFSEEAEQHFGNDVAYMLLVAPAEKKRVLSLLASESESKEPQSDTDSQLLHLMQQKFSDYFAVKAWFQEQQISFRSEFDSWA